MLFQLQWRGFLSISREEQTLEKMEGWCQLINFVLIKSANYLGGDNPTFQLLLILRHFSLFSVLEQKQQQFW